MVGVFDLCCMSSLSLSEVLGVGKLVIDLGGFERGWGKRFKAASTVAIIRRQFMLFPDVGSNVCATRHG